ncbi:DUF3365 domain-containing protein [Halobacteriovorax sp. JY17]|uniref:Tll0287-like domain-containing protein n=1 Tax=Halobacteriovorax sp. JY17 TaxID=2014617 RepID=UPI000C491C57|nr:DUF3365 domain-containing protein [Halobacteriovorax sp. JY17]PIK16412.1 MAG: hypothetical protein CES88_06640 [Halobacteriovorax sp. JY17]
MKLIILFTTFLLSHSSFAENKEDILSKIKIFQTALKVELQKGMKKSPLEAVTICNVKAPEIKKSLSSPNTQFGRVSLKNRNPSNYPKEWMLKYIEEFHNKETKEPYTVVKLQDGKQGLLKPIITMPLCLKCHGTNIKADLQEKISKLYPKDKAVGYKVGQIRGFFWSEF